MNFDVHAKGSAARLSSPAAPLILSVLALAACTGGASTSPTPAPQPKIAIVAPSQGQSLPGPTVTLKLTVTGVTLMAPDARHDPQSGHLHVFVDRPASPRGEPTPFEVGILHTKDTTISLKNLTVGSHRVVVVLGYGDHVPFDPEVKAEVRFTTT